MSQEDDVVVSPHAEEWEQEKREELPLHEEHILARFKAAQAAGQAAFYKRQDPVDPSNPAAIQTSTNRLVRAKPGRIHAPRTQKLLPDWAPPQLS